MNKIPYFKVGDFSDGDRRSFSPPRVFAELPAEGFGPRSVTFVLVEEDSGDQMGPFLDGMVETADQIAKADERGPPLTDDPGQPNSNDNIDWEEVFTIAKDLVAFFRKDDIFDPAPVNSSGAVMDEPQVVDFHQFDSSYRRLKL